MKKVICKSGLTGWQDKLQKVYSSLEEFEDYCDYGIHSRLGFETPLEAWDANPTIQGSTDPSDLRKATNLEDLEKAALPFIPSNTDDEKVTFTINHIRYGHYGTEKIISEATDYELKEVLKSLSKKGVIKFVKVRGSGTSRASFYTKVENAEWKS